MNRPVSIKKDFFIDQGGNKPDKFNFFLKNATVGRVLFDDIKYKLSP